MLDDASHPAFRDQREGRVEGTEVFDPRGDDGLLCEVRLEDPLGSDWKAQTEDLHQDGAVGNHEPLVDNGRVKGSGLRHPGGEPRERGHFLGNVAEQPGPVGRGDCPSEGHPDTTGSLVGLDVLDLRNGPIVSLGLFRGFLLRKKNFPVEKTSPASGVRRASGELAARLRFIDP